MYHSTHIIFKRVNNRRCALTQKNCLVRRTTTKGRLHVPLHFQMHLFYFSLHHVRTNIQSFFIIVFSISTLTVLCVYRKCLIE